MPTPEVKTLADGSRSFKVRFRENGRATSRTFANNREALRFAKNIENLGVSEAQRILDERSAVAAEILWSVKDWCLHHIELLTGVQEDTLKDYRAMVRNDLGLLADLPVASVRRDDMARWVKWMQSRPSRRGGGPLSGKTIANRHGFIAAAFNRAVEDDIAIKNPCNSSRLPQTITPPMSFLTHDEYAHFLSCVPAFWQPLVAMMFGSGVRWGEISALQVGDIDTHSMTVTVSRAWKRTGELGTPKTRKSARTIALSPETMNEIQPLINGRKPNDFLFTNRRGNKVDYSSFKRSVWERAVERADLGKHLRIHDARHTYASWLLASGIPINYVQHALGHESITTTVNRYGHIMPAAQQAIRSAMSNALAAAHPQLIEAA